jgi:hypothetical protein
VSPFFASLFDLSSDSFGLRGRKDFSVSFQLLRISLRTHTQKKNQCRSGVPVIQIVYNRSRISSYSELPQLSSESSFSFEVSVPLTIATSLVTVALAAPLPSIPLCFSKFDGAIYAIFHAGEAPFFLTVPPNRVALFCPASTPILTIRGSFESVCRNPQDIKD